MNGYYGQQPFPGQEFQPPGRSNTINNVNSMVLEGMSSPSMYEDATDAVTKQRRRQSFPNSYAVQQAQAHLDGHMRRGSMVEFGGGNSTTHNLNNFQFGQPEGTDAIMSAGSNFQDAPGANQHRQPLNLNTQYNGQDQTYSNMVATGSAYQSPIPHTPQMDMDINSNFMSQNMPLAMDYSDQALNSLMSSGGNSMNLFSQNQYTSPMMDSPMPPHAFSSPMDGTPRTDMTDNVDEKNDFSGSDRPSLSTTNSNTRQQSLLQTQPVLSTGQTISGQAPAAQMVSNMSYENSQMQQVDPAQHNLSWQQNSNPAFQNMMPIRPPGQTSYKNAYSSTGFDMLTVLMKVATRSHPEINIGAVDLSCSFVVCDVEKHDFPIVYCSDNFERLTGYNKHEILGRNCRFLQAPDGKVQAGVPRKYVDDSSVLYLKNMIAARKEAQISLINYRKGGQPFMNLLTMIPIAYDSDVIKFFVGFQVDLVEQPNSVTNKNPDGSYTINYQRGLTMPRYIYPQPENTQPRLESGQTVTRDDVSTVLSTIGNEESELSKRIWDKVLLENTDDVVHVLSLKGLFMYLSPSSKKILEYDAHELVGTALSSVCHPSDIVPVTRELKETSANSSVNVVFRIRRKNSGYMWFEGHGALHTDQGKGRKCIILVGRERPVYTLAKSDIDAAGGIGDNELWTKLSTSGMFLYVSSNVRSLLDRQPDEMVGTSMQALMRQDTKQEFGRILEIVRTGKKASVKHEMFNKRGQSLQAFSTIYPGDAAEGAKPTFMVAQTRLLKYSRNSSQTKRSSATPNRERDPSGGSVLSAPSVGGSITSGHGLLISRQNSNSGSMSIASASPNHYISTADAPTTHAGQDGLAIGHQDVALASDENVFDELKTTRSTSWQFELRQMEKSNRLLAEEVQSLLAQKKKRKRRKGAGQMEKDCANCHTRVTPEWRRGPSGNRDLCNSCGLRWAKQQGRVSPRTSQRSQSEKGGTSPLRRTKGSDDEADGQGRTDSNGNAGPSKTAQQTNEDSHASKMAKMEATPAEGFGGGIPSKIEEDIEPD